MKCKTFAFLLLGAFVVSAPNVDAASNFSFEAPAQLSGSINVHAPGVHGFVSEANGFGSIRGTTVVLETKTVAGLEADDVVYWNTAVASSPWEEVANASVSSPWELNAEGRWGMRVISSEVSMAATSVQILSPAISGGGFPSAVAPPGTFPAWREPLTARSDGPSILASNVTTVEVRGNFTVELYSVSISDPASGTETRSGTTQNLQGPIGGGGSVIRYSRLSVNQGMLELEGEGIQHAGLADHLSASLVTGVATFPLAQSAAAEGGRTWQVEGPAYFADVDSTSPQTYSATATWSSANVRVDGQQYGLDSAEAIAITSVGLVGSLLILFKAAPTVTALLTRLPPGKALENENRRKLYDYILDNPGATFREVLRGTEIPAGTARHHLNVLRRSDMIVEHGHRSTLRFFENHGKFDATWTSVVLLREDPLSQVYDWLENHPGAIQRELLEHAETDWEWSRSTTQHRLARLIDGGLVSVHHMGRRKAYHVVHPRDAEPAQIRASWT